MKLTDLMESQELLELGILDRFTKAGKAASAGADKAAKIFTNLKAQYFNLVGGSGSSTSTLTDLQNFMTGHGLDVSKLPPVSDPARLTSADIDNSLKAVVAQNYSRIIAAQRGDYVTPAQTQTTTQVSTPNTAQPSISAAPVGPTPEQVRKQKQAAAAKAAQSQMTSVAPVSSPVTALSPEEIRKQKQAAAAKAAQAQMTPAAPTIAPATVPTPAAPVQPARKPRAPRKPAAPKSKAPESKQQDKPVVAEYYSKFLGINL